MDMGPELTLAEYQRQAQKTNRLPQGAEGGVDPRLVPLLGLVGEIGTLVAEYKKHLRDGTAYELFETNVEEDLGDILWYLAAAAGQFDLSLQHIAERNLSKAADRWRGSHDAVRQERSPADHFDAQFSPEEQLPREFYVDIRPVAEDTASEPKVEILWNNQPVADQLGDNTYDDTGYRFHDVFHLANAAVLGWSPVARTRFFQRKRKSNPRVDNVEDGGRAIVIEEAIAAYMFAYARNHNYLEGVTSLDFHVLKTFRAFTEGLEVEARQLWEVEDAVLQGAAAWRHLRQHGGGVLRGCLTTGRLEYLGSADQSGEL